MRVHSSKDVGRPRVRAVLGDQVAVNALIDTGAEISTFSWTKFRSLTQPPPLHASSSRIQAANRSMIEVKGKVTIPIRIGARRFSHTFVVVSGLSEDCVLGIDFLHLSGLTPNPRKGTLTWDDSIPVSSNLKVTIAPNSQAALRFRSPPLPTSRGSQSILFSPLHPNCIEGLVHPKEKQVLVVNVSNYPLTIEEGEAIGWVRPEKIESVSLLSREEGELDAAICALSRSDLDQLNLSHVPSEHQERYRAVIEKAKSVFSKDSYDVGHCQVLPQKIVLKDPNKISCVPPYRLPENLRPAAKNFIGNLAETGIIRPSNSPFSSPLMLVKKRDAAEKSNVIDQYRVVHDYRRLNENTVRDCYPMRNLYELLDSVAGAKIWTVIDLSSGFWNQELTPESRPYTAFGMPGLGHWEYTRSAQGLTNSPAAFQRLLDFVLRDLPGVFVYIDDVVVCSQTHEEHADLLGQVFERFRKHKLKCKLSKLQIGTGEVNYLGYNISRDKGIRAGEAKIQIVKDWKAPTSVTEVKQFLGLCSFFRRTIRDFATCAKPLTNLTKQDSAWKGGPLPPNAMTAFVTLKSKLCTRPCLQPVNFEKEFIITTDASNVGLGAILSQKDDKGIEHPCAYASRVLNSAEQKWAPTHLEHLAMVWGCRHFKPYLAGRHFTIRTDHKPLVSLNRIQGQALERLRAELDDYRPFTVEYLKGELMPADGLSRSCSLCALLLDGGLDELRRLPTSFTLDQLYDLQKGDKEAKAIVCWLKYKSLPGQPQLRDLVNVVKDEATLKRGVIHLEQEGKLVPYAPREIRSTLLYHAHDSPVAGHRGTAATLERLRGQWAWPYMDKEVETYCHNCRVCLSVNNPAHKRPAPMKRLTPAVEFNQRVHCDLLGPWPNDEGNTYLLVVQDAYSKLIELKAIPHKTAEIVAEALYDGWIASHGPPATLVSDQGKEFVNKINGELCKKLWITHQTTSAMHPQANGLVERTNRDILAYLRKFLEGGNVWVRLLPSLKMAYNSSWHSSLRTTPFFAAFGRRPRTVLDLPTETYAEDDLSQKLRLLAKAQADIVKREQEAWETQKKSFDKRAKEKQVLVGDVVYANRPHSGKQFQKFQPLWIGPYVVVGTFPESNNVQVKRADGKIITLHLDRVKLAGAQEQVYVLPPRRTPSGSRGHPATSQDPDLTPSLLDDGSDPAAVPAPEAPEAQAAAPEAPPPETPPPAAEDEAGYLAPTWTPERAPRVSFDLPDDDSTPPPASPTPTADDVFGAEGPALPIAEPESRRSPLSKIAKAARDVADTLTSPFRRQTRQQAAARGVVVPDIFPYPYPERKSPKKRKRKPPE